MKGRTTVGLLMYLVMVGSSVEAGLVDGFFEKAFNQLRPKLKNIYKESAAVSPQLTLTNLFVNGLDEFYTKSLSVNLLPLKLNNLTILIDNIEAASSYRMDFMSLPGPIVLSGAGDISIQAAGVRLYTQATLGSKGGKIFIKDILDIELTLRDLKIKMSGIEGGGPVGELISGIFNKVGKPMFNAVATQALKLNEAQLITMINQVLLTIDVKKK